MVDPSREKTKGLFELYQEEKKAETRTKGKLKELQDNSDRVLKCKLRLIEKLLDVKMKDELSMARQAANVAVVEPDTSMVGGRAETRFMREVDGLIPAARDKYADTFVCHFEAISSAGDDETTQQIAKAVREDLDSELSALAARRATNQNEPSTVDAVDREAEAVIFAGQKAVREGQTRDENEQEDRMARVKAAEEKLLKPAAVTLSSLAELMECVPVQHSYNIGRLEAEINDLRNLIYAQRGEEEKLLLDRSTKLANLDDEESELQDEVAALQDDLTTQQEELATKRTELQQMLADGDPTVGKWVHELRALEESLDFVMDEEMKLKQDYETVAKAVGSVDADKRLVNEKFYEEVDELSNLQDQYRQIVDKIEEQLFAYKEQFLAIRQDDLTCTRRINDLRHQATAGGDERSDNARQLKERLNQSISQLAIEERLQSVLQAKIILMEQDTDTLKANWSSQISEQVIETENLKRAIEEQFNIVRECTDEMADLKSAMRRGISAGAPRHSASQYEEMVAKGQRQWASMVFDTAREVADTKAQILVNEEENEVLLDAMGHLVVLGEIMRNEGVDVENGTTPQLAATANRMYDDLAAASYRETKLNQLLRIFLDIEERRAAGEPVPKLTGKRHLSRAERRTKRSIKENSWLAKEIARQNVTLQKAFPPEQRDAAPGSPPNDPSAGGATLEQDHKLRVVNFIKSEIQPLYNTDQITKKRFVDIVARASTAYLETYPPSSYLAAEDKQWLSRKIQEVITLQDEERSRRRADTVHRR
eukprot:TRINITY_DN3007_c0_g3_i1.p1 TRINITY_DN3007_c0_g3~~TRINITY_DN3007_c0_g3_i1.p1  ORF type:complete len:770 (+),score=357.52 TRINITY_DN3007_c0_g3_i1:72-2381(+)